MGWQARVRRHDAAVLPPARQGRNGPPVQHAIRHERGGGAMASNAMTWPRERRSGASERNPGQRPGNTLPGGEPYARGAAPSTPACPPSRPGPRVRAPPARRLLSLLPVLALLLAALSPFAAAPAAADVLVSNLGQTAIHLDSHKQQHQGAGVHHRQPYRGLSPWRASNSM